MLSLWSVGRYFCARLKFGIWCGWWWWTWRIFPFSSSPMPVLKARHFYFGSHEQVVWIPYCNENWFQYIKRESKLKRWTAKQKQRRYSKRIKLIGNDNDHYIVPRWDRFEYPVVPRLSDIVQMDHGLSYRDSCRHDEQWGEWFHHFATGPSDDRKVAFHSRRFPSWEGTLRWDKRVWSQSFLGLRI